MLHFVSAEDWREPASLSSLCSSHFALVPRPRCLPPRFIHFPQVSTLTSPNKYAGCCSPAFFAYLGTQVFLASTHVSPQGHIVRP